jgi:hypothetical protein
MNYEIVSLCVARRRATKLEAILSVVAA